MSDTEKLPKLFTRSDGLSETGDGRFAIVMKAFSGTHEGNRYLAFKPKFDGDTIYVVWPIDNPFVLVPQDVATALIGRGRAKPVTAEMVEEYNAALEPEQPVEKTTKKKSDPKPEPTAATDGPDQDQLWAKKGE